MNGDIVNILAGVAVAVGVCVVGVWYLWGRARGRPVEPDDLVTVAEFTDATQAKMWKMRLESQGVRCVLIGEDSFNYTGTQLASVNIIPIRLQVLARDVGRARQIIEAS